MIPSSLSSEGQRNASTTVCAAVVFTLTLLTSPRGSATEPLRVCTGISIRFSMRRVEAMARSYRSTVSASRVSGHNSEARKWAVAIEAPSTSRRAPQSIIRITDTGVATSGDYRNYFEYDGVSYSHTIDPRTGRPVTHDLAAVTVLQPSAAFADAMATALLVLGPDDGPELAEDLGGITVEATGPYLNFRVERAALAGAASLVLGSLAADLTMAAVDPRVRLGGRSRP